eukprot:c24528_g1_i1.p1 GENE.c24528_g1_i1~~c24528_g1_i1.p1  ORF type:complete len:267 (+),score=-10.74 c24528_g1_i1:41-841(+)
MDPLLFHQGDQSIIIDQNYKVASRKTLWKIWWVYTLLCIHLISECIIFTKRQINSSDSDYVFDLVKLQCTINIPLFLISVCLHISIKYDNIQNSKRNITETVILSMILYICLVTANGLSMYEKYHSTQYSSQEQQTTIFQFFINFCSYSQQILAYSYFCGPPNIDQSLKTKLKFVLWTSLLLSIIFNVLIFLLSFVQKVDHCDNRVDTAAFVSETCLLTQITNLTINYFRTAHDENYFAVANGNRNGNGNCFKCLKRYNFFSNVRK